MQQKTISQMGWMNKYRAEITFVNESAMQSLTNLFKCPLFGHDKVCTLKWQLIYQYTSYLHQQVSSTARITFRNKLLSLRKWFYTVHTMCSMPCDLTATELATPINVSWSTIKLIFCNLKWSVVAFDWVYFPSDLVKGDNDFVGGKRGAGAQCKTPALFEIEKRYDSQGIAAFGFIPTITPPDQTGERLHLVYVIIDNFKSFLISIFHKVSKQCLKEYNDEFAFHLSHKYWIKQSTHRMLNTSTEHEPVKYWLLII